MKYQFEISEDSFILVLPKCFIDITKLNIQLQTEPNKIIHDVIVESDVVEISGKSNNVRNDLNLFFSEFNEIPYYTSKDNRDFIIHSSPLISCIILLTFNDLFVTHSLIPSIIENSGGYPIEIIIAYNGEKCDTSHFTYLKIINTEPFQVAKSYNQAIKQAKGKYIALFHDDCILDDELWIKKSIETISGDTVATTSEFDLVTAKFVPLVIKKQTIEKLGYLDEHYFFGIEDLDLTFNIYSQGCKIENCINAFHARGMSTILLYSLERSFFKKIFSYNILNADTVRMIQQICLNNAMKKGSGHLTIQYIYHFLNKYGDTVKNIDSKYYYTLKSLTRNISAPSANNENAISELIFSEDQRLTLDTIIKRFSCNNSY